MSSAAVVIGDLKVKPSLILLFLTKSAILVSLVLFFGSKISCYLEFIGSIYRGCYLEISYFKFCQHGIG